MNFPAGEDVFLIVAVSAKDDDIVEPLENFTLYIEVGHDALHHGVVHSHNGTVTISLEDNDSECSSNTSTLQTLPISIDLSVYTWSACNTDIYCT